MLKTGLRGYFSNFLGTNDSKEDTKAPSALLQPNRCRTNPTTRPMKLTEKAPRGIVPNGAEADGALLNP